MSLICDPWLSGTAFNRGWRTIAEPQFSPEDFSRVTHIWFSHQHPDHFAPQDLRRIPAHIRKEITILYHKTIDKKVIRFCKALDFKDQIELRDGQWYRLDAGFEIQCGTWFDFDSWLAIRTLQGTFLNLNDCIVDTRALAKKIQRLVGPVRVLLTQFSYADYQGGPAEIPRRVASARDKIERIRTQASVFSPEIVIPFASFVYWCHPENFHMNFEMNRIENVAAFIRDELHRMPVVLYPGETWRVGDERDWQSSSQHYARDLATRLSAGPTETPTSVPMELLERSWNRFVARLKKNNPLLRFLRSLGTTVSLYDLGIVLHLSQSGMESVSQPTAADIEMSSDSFLFCLKAPWGSNALHVNGRFTSPNGNYVRFFDFFKAADWADHGYTLKMRNLPRLIGAARFRVQTAVQRRLERRLYPQPNVR